LGHRRLDLGTRLKKHLDDRDALHGLRLDVLDIIADFRGGKSPHIIHSKSLCFARRGGLVCEPIFPPDGRDYHALIEV
jgi:hypothetical protein